MNFSGWYSGRYSVALAANDMRRQISIIMLTGLVVGLSALSVQGAESCSDKTVPALPPALLEKAREQAVIDDEAIKNAMDKARERAKAITILENKHSAAGKKAAEETNAVYRSQEFQDKVKYYEQGQEDLLIPRAKKEIKEQEKGILADSEKIYLFLSSSIPESSFQGYMAYLDGVPEIVPVMMGMVGGRDKKHKKERIKWWSKVLKKDTTCEDKPEARCDKLKVPITIKPALFRQYEITEVPTLIYARGDEVFQLQGDVGIVTLLETVNQEAKSPSLTALTTKIRER